MIRKADIQDMEKVARLAHLLWPDHALNELRDEMKTFITGKNSVIFLMYEKEHLVGFAQCQLRNDYVEGTQTSPVGYLEGVYVSEKSRGKGYGRQLVKKCEEWTLEKGCSEFGSDCELSNEDSLAFHLKSGFKEVIRTISFVKKVKG